MPIEHVVIIVKENHIFDNYFGTLPGADGQQLGHAPNPPPVDPLHDHLTWMLANKPTRLAQFDDGNDRAILVQGDEGPAQVVRLGHRGTPSVTCSDEVATSSPPAP
jgi:hypothetical protein